MKCTLVRPPSFTTTTIIPNLGLGYLASVLLKAGHSVTIIDCAKARLDHEGYREYLEREKPDVLGIQMFTCDFNSTKQCLDIAKQLNKRTVTIVGGPHPSGDPTGTMEELGNTDFAFTGEAEIGLPGLLEYIESKKEAWFKDIPGLIYRDKGQVMINRQEGIGDLDSIPFPSWDLINPRTYPTAVHGSFSKSLPVAPIVTTRGCPFGCTYCAAKVINGRGFRSRSIDNIIAEIKYLQDKFGIKEIHIEDDNFTLMKPRVMDFCRRLKEERIFIDWACPNGVRLDTLDEELLLTMEEAGCYSFAVGIESGSPKILQDMKKGTALETMIEKTKLIASVSKIRMTGFFIMGYPSETKDDMEKTIELAKRLPLHRAQFSNFLPLPGTEIYLNLIKNGRIEYKSIKWDSYRDNSIVYSPSGIAVKDLRRMMRKAFAGFYFRPSIIFGLLKEMHSFRQLKNVILRFFDTFK